jgi:hypothetical protein
VDPRLLAAISTPKIRSQAGELTRLALIALEDMKALDESLYERFVATRNQPTDPAENAAELRKLWGATFKGLQQLLVFCRTLEGIKTREGSVPPEPAEPAEFDLDLEAVPQATDGFGDLSDFFADIDEPAQEGDTEKWAKVLEKVSSIEYGLRTQYKSGESRLHIALGVGENNQVLALFDDTQSSACEGVHALVSTVYEVFVPDVNPSSVVPGYFTSLGRALLVRRGLAELTASLRPHNERVQRAGKESKDALAAIKDEMASFVSSIVCRAMRPADRWQMVEFERMLDEQSDAEAKLTCEGLTKYLESLASVNQREVLLMHDHKALDQMRESLANARQLMDLSPSTAVEMIGAAYQAAQRLRGRRPTTDRLMVELEPDAVMLSIENSGTVLDKLEQLLAKADTRGD